MRGMPMTSVWQDVRYGLRVLAKSSGSTAIAILTLALGIGAITTIFSVIDSVLLNPFPYKNADRLATPSIRLRDVLRMVLKSGLVLVTAGALAGVIMSLALTRLIASQIWGVSATDPWTFSVVVLVLFVAGLAACLLPARRATQVNPLIALHSE
jgi:hypothetical protein